MPGSVNYPDIRKAGRGRKACLARWAATDEGLTYAPEDLAASFPQAKAAEAAISRTTLALPADVALLEPNDLGLGSLDPLRITYTSPLLEDEWYFCRAQISGQQEWIYFFEGLFDADAIRIAGLGQPNDETAIQMYLRIADHTCETLPEKITCESAFKAEKSWLLRWSQVGYYRDFPDLLESDFASCEYVFDEPA